MLIFLSIGSSLAQSNVFRARVVDAETGEAMPYVNVLSDAGIGLRHFGLFSGEYWGMTGQGASIQSSLEHTDLRHMAFKRGISLAS